MASPDSRSALRLFGAGRRQTQGALLPKPSACWSAGCQAGAVDPGPGPELEIWCKDGGGGARNPL